MKQAVLISIKPEWVRLIESGKKTVEIRKTRPKVDTPFKCYIYCSKGSNHEALMINGDGSKLIACLDRKTAIPVGGAIGNGTVVGEFICDICTEFTQDYYELSLVSDGSCVPIDEIRAYLGAANKNGYVWHIRELKMYDKPKNLKEFLKWGRECYWSELPMVRPKSCVDCGATGCHVYHAPQSWCYVEELP